MMLTVRGWGYRSEVTVAACYYCYFIFQSFSNMITFSLLSLFVMSNISSIQNLFYLRASFFFFS